MDELIVRFLRTSKRTLFVALVALTYVALYRWSVKKGFKLGMQYVISYMDAQEKASTEAKPDGEPGKLDHSEDHNSGA